MKNGTPDYSAPSLCRSCRWATIARGHSLNEEITQCSYIDKLISFTVTQCTNYQDKATATLNQMEDIAWLLVTRGSGKKIGFVRAKDMKEEQRNKLLREVREP